jgi:hypothetical protein
VSTNGGGALGPVELARSMNAKRLTLTCVLATATQGSAPA